MNLRLLLLSLLCLIGSHSNARQQGRLSVHASFGPQLNFFANSFNEADGPQPHRYFYNKKQLGSMAGIGLRYALNPSSYLTLEYNQSVNKSRKNSSFDIDNVAIDIDNFTLRYINHYFQLGYGRVFAKKWSAELGIVYVTTTNQSITYDGGTFGTNGLVIDETNLKKSGAEEGGFYAGLGWEHPIDTRLHLGLRLRGYYLVSIGFFEALSFTPTLRYRLGR